MTDFLRVDARMALARYESSVAAFGMEAGFPMKDVRVVQEYIKKLESVTKDDAKWLAAYHKWCEMNGCAPSSSDLISARKALEGKDD
jgi:hypothetical protein